MENIKANQSLYWPGQVPRVPGGWRFQNSKRSAREGGKVVNPQH